MYEYKELEHPCYSKLNTLTSKHVGIFDKNDTCELEKPFCVLTNLYEEEEERIRNFEVQKDDVWIASYPRSGTTWTQEMVWLICNNLDYTTAKNVILNERYSFLELSTHDAKYKPRNTIETAINQKSPRHIKTHLPTRMLPAQIWTKKPKIVYVARDPKDVVVSYYHHCRVIAGYVGTFEDFADCFLQDKILYSPFWNHILSYWQLRNEPNVLFLRYEDMKSNMMTILKQVSAFFNKNYNDAQLEELARHLDFQCMKNNPACNNKADISGTAWSYDVSFIRKGKAGGWKDEMSQELADEVDAWSRRETFRTDYVL